MTRAAVRPIRISVSAKQDEFYIVGRVQHRAAVKRRGDGAASTEGIHAVLGQRVT